MNSCVWQSLKVFVALSALVGFTQTARAESTLSSLGVRSVDGEDELERRLSTALRASAKAIGEFSVSDREASLDQMLLALGCDDADAPCLSQIARTLSVDKLIYGSVVDQSGSYELTLFVFDTAGGRIEQMAAHGISPDLLSASNAEPTVEKVLRRLLGKDQPVAAPAAGKLRIEGGVPGTELLLDGSTPGTLDDQGMLVLDLPAGQHTVRPAGAEYGAGDERTVLVVAGSEATLSLAPVTTIPLDQEQPPGLGDQPPAPSGHSSARLRRNIGFATIGVGVALAIATIYSWARIEHINHDSSYKEYRAAFPRAGTPGGVSNVCGPASRGELAAREPTQSRLEQKANDLCGQADTLEVLQYVFLGGAIAAGGVGTYLVLSARTKDKAQPSTLSSLKLNPRFGAQSAGLAATLSF